MCQKRLETVVAAARRFRKHAFYAFYAWWLLFPVVEGMIEMARRRRAVANNLFAQGDFEQALAIHRSGLEIVDGWEIRPEERFHHA